MMARHEAAISGERFRLGVLADLERARGTYIYEACVRDLIEKLDPADPCGYRPWLRGVLEYLRATYALQGLRVLDLGCGKGELTVMLNLMGYDATGVDVSEGALRLARILAGENAVPSEKLILGSGRQLPFEDRSFDLVMMVSSLEHIEDDVLPHLVPEIDRVCRGVAYVQVPSAMKVSDDHTGLKFVPWMPRWMAGAYIRLRGRRYRYLISESSEWDVTYRDLDEIERAFGAKFLMDLVPPQYSYPPCTPESAVLSVSRDFRIAGLDVRVKIPLFHRNLSRLIGKRIEHFYPYYNVVFRKRCG